MVTDISSYNNLDFRPDDRFIWSQFDAAPKAYSAFIRECRETIRQEENKAILSASILGTSVTVDGQSIESYFDDDVRVLKYCLARIDEIEAINRYSHTPSAYGCILSFLAFLGQASHNATNRDEMHFREFCNKHLCRLRCHREEREESGSNPNLRSRNGNVDPGVNTWGEVLYKLVRCGLIHAMSSAGNREPLQNEIEIRLTHCHIQEDVGETFDFIDIQQKPKPILDPSWKAATITINAFDLIDAVRDSILHIYTEGSDVQNMRAYFKAHPPLMAVVDNKQVT